MSLTLEANQRQIEGQIMEYGYALGLTVTALSTFVAIWINDTFKVGGELTGDLGD